MIDTAKLASMMMGNSITKEKAPKKVTTDNWWDVYIFVTSNNAKKTQGGYASIVDELRFDIKSDPLQTERGGITMLQIVNKVLSENFGLSLKEESTIKVEGKKGHHIFRYSVQIDAAKMESLQFVGEVNALDYSVQITDYAAYVKTCNKCIKGICLELAKNKMTPTYIYAKEKTTAPGIQYPFGLLK